MHRTWHVPAGLLLIDKFLSVGPARFVLKPESDPRTHNSRNPCSIRPRMTWDEHNTADPVHASQHIRRRPLWIEMSRLDSCIYTKKTDAKPTIRWHAFVSPLLRAHDSVPMIPYLTNSPAPFGKLAIRHHRGSSLLLVLVRGKQPLGIAMDPYEVGYQLRPPMRDQSQSFILFFFPKIKKVYNCWIFFGMKEQESFWFKKII